MTVMTIVRGSSAISRAETTSKLVLLLQPLDFEFESLLTREALLLLHEADAVDCPKLPLKRAVLELEKYSPTAY
jgi:hypothetical protein